jgi:uncharacterized protein YraI
MKVRFWPVYGFILLLLMTTLACGAGGNEPEVTAPLVVPTDPAVVATVIVVATPTLAQEAPAAADVPTLSAPTAQPGFPTMTALVSLNVRTGPGTNYPVVGAFGAGQTATIVGKSQDGSWWKIQCPAGTGSECWASAQPQYATAVNVEGVLVAAAPSAPTHVPAQATATTALAQVSPTATLQGGATATATQPGGATPTYTPTPSATQPGDPTATYTNTPPAASPTATQPGQPTATYTHTPSPTATQPTVQIAPFDNDSLQNPAQSVFMSITGVRNFSHTNDVSYANGDQDDWVEFEFPNNANTSQPVWVTLNCNLVGGGNAQLRATLYEDGAGTTQIVLCNDGEKQLTVNNTKTQQLRIHFGITAPDIYATYTLTVIGFR